MWSDNLVSGVIVDTSEWVQYFRVPNSPEGMEVRRLLEAQEVVMVGMVYAELLRGARTDEQFQNLAVQLGALPFGDMTKQTWASAGKILNDLQRQGNAIALPDAAIAALALEQEVEIFSRDEHFSSVPDLRLHAIEV